MLYIIATPIGNLKDITLRSLETLKEVDAIICEDTRRTGILLSHYEIKKPLITLNDFNEPKLIPSIIERLQSGQNLALVSDAGTPLVSDPGYKLVRSCIEQNVPVDSLPGPSAAITALTLSGLAPDKFFFVGYLPEKPGKRQNMLKDLKEINEKIKNTFIVYVAPHKLSKTLEDMKEVYGDINVVLAHELTKMHQSVDNKKISEFLTSLKNPKGEYVLLFNC